ncbi:Endoplasmic reticulum mannosyl-oligosaccharide 1,2-alpha-mannosidase [Hypsizygus marmoreus]|uniref:alpha-1,2-Mannosidase n=1 Tax=Hypsizygus marmoreus TaxID=39966 RepID=A0A369KEK8_HYPMA|nr:Endoplasmic reticulum mannosyl-oligosaccharide 1,2-alpha-mannosidase [Hypsizygus marmoreus]
MLPIYSPATPSATSLGTYHKPWRIHKHFWSRRWPVLACFLAVFVLVWLLEPYRFPLPFYSDHDDELVPLEPVPAPPSKNIPRPLADISEVVKEKTWEGRKEQVRKAYLHALEGYKQHAFPDDELLALSGGKSNKFNGWSVTLLDSMDTMWMMGLHDEFRDAVRVVAAQNFTLVNQQTAPFFETVIRYLGGLLSSYALSGEPILLARADDLGRMLLPVFDANPSGLPAYGVNTKTGETSYGWMGSLILFSEATSCQLEYKYLAKLTGRKEYYIAVDHIMEHMYRANVPNGLFPLTWSREGHPRDKHYSVGASADSGYEYLLKQYLLSGDTKSRAQYLMSIDGIITNLLYLTPTRHLLYVTDMNYKTPTHNLEHLSCFLPGVLALGAYTLELPEKTRTLHQRAAEGLAYTCYTTYADTTTGLGPDGVYMVRGESWVEALEKWEHDGAKGVVPGLEEFGVRVAGERDYRVSGSAYLLRPETIESMFMLWKTTGDVKWRERGYEIFLAIERVAKTKYGYASVDRVDDEVPRQIDDMPSYFLAETLKYLYLLFDDTDAYPIGKWVYNTEAHPLPVFEWTEWERKAYGIEDAA